MRSRSVGNLYDGLKLVEKSTATLMKKTRQINNTNKMLEPVESKKLFWCQKISTSYNFLFVLLFHPVLFSNAAVLFSLNFNLSYRLVTILDLTQDDFFFVPSGRLLDTLHYGILIWKHVDTQIFFQIKAQN